MSEMFKRTHEEDVSEWQEGPDIVIERQPCVPGEDVKVQVIRGGAIDAASSDHSSDEHAGGHHEIEILSSNLKEALKKVESGEAEEVERVKERCREVGRAIQGRDHGVGTDTGDTITSTSGDHKA